MSLAAFARRIAFLHRRNSSRPQLAAPTATSVSPLNYMASEATPERVDNLVSLLEGYFQKGGQHININVLDPAKLRDAMDHPERYPQLTIRVSGYAVHFHRLSREQQLDVINRTFHGSL